MTSRVASDPALDPTVDPADLAHPPRVAFTVEEAAAACGVSPRTVYEARTAGHLIGSRLGKRWVFTRTDLERWVAGRRRDDRSLPTRLRSTA